MFIQFARNEYGTQVSAHICDTCGKFFTVCPAKGPERDDWGDCLGVECESYDPARDADLLFDAPHDDDPEIIVSTRSK